MSQRSLFDDADGVDPAPVTVTVPANWAASVVVTMTGSFVPVIVTSIVVEAVATPSLTCTVRVTSSVSPAARKSKVLSAAEKARGGEVFVTKMPVIQIADLARVMVDELAEQHGYSASRMPITEIGAKPGEKLYEELMSDEETRRTVELAEMFAVLPAFRSVYEEISYDYADLVSRTVENAYVSSPENAMTVEQLGLWCRRHELLTPYLQSAPILPLPSGERRRAA